MMRGEPFSWMDLEVFIVQVKHIVMGLVQETPTSYNMDILEN